MESHESSQNDRKPVRLGVRAVLLGGTGIVVLHFVGATLGWTTVAFILVVLAGVVAWGKRAYRRVVAILVIGLLVIELLVPLVKKSWGILPQISCASNYRELGIALACYEEQRGHLPPAYIADATGKPMHSWRVLLLPHLNQEVIYKQYRFDEPWDGPNNRKLHNIEMPIFHCPSDPSNKTMTSYVAITGPETAWPGTWWRRFSEIKDGLTYTATVAEMSESGIHWMEPRDLPMIGMPPRMNDPCNSSIRSKHVGGANVLFGDGRCHSVRTNVPWRILRGFLTVEGGEQLSENDLDGWR